ncbi:hypothetical protein KIN20_000108, partial [Parelaphostrongylus tenuis]
KHEDIHCQRVQQLTYYRGLHRKQRSFCPGPLVLQPARVLFRHLHNVLQCKQWSMFSKSKVEEHSCLIL